MNRGYLWVVVLMMAVALAACGGGDGDDTDDTSSPAAQETDAGQTEASGEGPRTVPIQVDGLAGDSNVALLGYFPRDLTVRAGDTVEFTLEPGDPHTMTFGTLVDDGLAALADAEEGAPPPEAVQAIPQAFGPDGSAVATGILPCFSDEPPTDGSPCEEVDQPAFDGSLAFYNSGLLEPTDTFAMEVAEDAAPGTYSYFCLVHGPDMSGTLTVVEADGSAPSPDEVMAAADQEVQAVIDNAQPALDAQPQGTLPGFEELLPDGPNTVLAGGFLPGDVPVDILQFGAEEVQVTAGESVTWTVLGFHTISFNAPQDATPPFILGEDGLPAANPLAFAPQGGSAGAPPPPEGEGPPPDGPPAVTVVEGGQWDGNGFFSSGILPSFPPALLGYEVTFTTPGTYTYACLVHPDMEGTINVTS